MSEHTGSDTRVIYVNTRVAGARQGEVLTVEWSPYWERHAGAGNVTVVRDEPAPEYTSGVNSYDPPATEPYILDAPDFLDEVEASLVDSGEEE